MWPSSLQSYAAGDLVKEPDDREQSGDHQYADGSNDGHLPLLEHGEQQNREHAAVAGREQDRSRKFTKRHDTNVDPSSGKSGPQQRQRDTTERLPPRSAGRGGGLLQFAVNL